MCDSDKKIPIISPIYACMGRIGYILYIIIIIIIIMSHCHIYIIYYSIPHFLG